MEGGLYSGSKQKKRHWEAEGNNRRSMGHRRIERNEIEDEIIAVDDKFK